MLNKSSIKAILLAVMVSLVSTCVFAIENTEASNLSAGRDFASDQLWELIRILREERTAFGQQQTKLNEKIDETRDTIQILQQKHDELKTKHDRLDNKIAGIQQKIESMKQNTANDKSACLILNRQIDNFVSTASERIRTAIPYKKEKRLSRLPERSQEETLESSAAISDDFARIWSFAEEEFRIATSGETFTSQITLDDETKPYARLFRVGHQMLGFFAEEGSSTGLWMSGESGNQWLTMTSYFKMSSVVKAIDILDRNTAPALVQIPVQVKIDTISRSSDNEEQNKNDK
jgi:FtsZ-binding cell division protein ZapB